MTVAELSQYFKKLEDTPSRIEMTKILSDLFKHAGKEEIGEICYLLQGRVAPLYEATEFGVADKLMIRAIAKACDSDDKTVLSEFKKQGDLGTAAQEIKNRTHKTNKTHTTVKEIFYSLRVVAQSCGEGSQEKKIQILADLIASLDPLSVRYVVRIPLDKLRLGFSDMTILDAFSWMLVGDKSLHIKLEDAYNVRPDMAYIGRQLKANGIKGIQHVSAVVGAPILASLCARLPNAVEMIKKMDEVDVEGKYDGVRTQIHFIAYHKGIPGQARDDKGGNWVQSFSRNLENTTAMYPELTHIGKQIDGKEVILDSEAIGYDLNSDRLIPFQETMTRKRKHDVTHVSHAIPLRFFVFDILYKDGKDLMGEPLSKRRRILEDTIIKGDVLVVSPHIVTTNVADLRKYHDEQLKKGLEGAVVKKWNSPYEPGRKGFHWVKFKEEEGKTGKLTDTIDAVVMGYYKGEGKRAGFGIGAFLVGVKKGERFVTLTKIGTGVSDELWKQLKTAFSHESSRRRQGYSGQAAYRPKEYEEVNKALEPDVWIDPTIVVEIAADDITVSPIHQAGYALRFPRLVRVRDDKHAGQATTVAEITTMYKNQKSVK
jgi:DNA ligase-1